jgi:hypothetical protein
MNKIKNKKRKRVGLFRVVNCFFLSNSTALTMPMSKAMTTMAIIAKSAVVKLGIWETTWLATSLALGAVGT